MLSHNTFVITVPKQGPERPSTQFRFVLGAPVADFKSQVAAELDTDAQLLDADGKPVPDNSLLLEVLTKPTSLLLGDDDPITINACITEGGFPTECGHVQLQSLMQKANYMRVRKVLEASTKRKISYQDYLNVCESNGVPLTEAADLCRKLHDVGILFHFHESESADVRETVFLKPEEVTDAVFAEFGLQSPTQLLVEEESSKKTAQLAALRQQLQDMTKLKDTVDTAANRTAQRASWLGFAALTGGSGFMVWLTYVKFSWDIMEPVTYFTGTFFGVVGFIWWHYATTDFEYANLRDIVLQSSRKKGYARHGFDEERYNELYAEVEKVQAEVEALDMTGYNPALISAYLSRHTG